MRTPSKILLPTLSLLAAAISPASALTPFSDKFSAGSLKGNRWSLIKEGGQLVPSTGRLLYSGSGGENNAAIFLRGGLPKFSESWEVTVDAGNSTRGNFWSWIGVAVLNEADPDDFVGLEISSGPNHTEILSDFGVDGRELEDVVRKTSAAQATLKVAFSHVTKTITLSYRTAPTAAWKVHATFSPTNAKGTSRRGNWRMNAKTGKFILALYGGSDAAKIQAGPMWLDNFALRAVK